MPSLASHQSNDYVKLLAIGDAKTGKTGSLVSLVKAGYRLRILDTDNLLDILKYMLQEEFPEGLAQVEYRSLRDKYKAGAGGLYVPKPSAFVQCMKMIDNWKYKEDDGTEVDLGPPSSWGDDCILVIDSLSRLCDAAYTQADSLNLPGKSGEADGRVSYKDAQDGILALLSQLTSPDFTCNVIVIAHVAYQETQEGLKGYPQGVGNKLSPKIPQFFPNYVLYQNKGGKRTIHTSSTPLMDLSSTAPLKIQKTYPIETGLAEFFAALRPPPKQDPVVTPLKRRN